MRPLTGLTALHLVIISVAMLLGRVLPPSPAVAVNLATGNRPSQTVLRDARLGTTFHVPLPNYFDIRYVQDGFLLTAFRRGASDRQSSDDLFAYRLFEGGLQPITDTPLDVTLSAYTPDAAWVVYRAYRAAGTDVTLVGPDREETDLPLTGFSTGRVTLSPDGRYAAYDIPASEGMQTVLADLTSGETVSPASLVGMENRFSWSPDGKWLAVDSGQSLSLLDLRGDLLQPRGIDLGAYLTPPVWSPLSTRMAVITFNDGVPRLTVIDVASGELTHVTDVARGYHEVAWSPDARTIAVTRYGSMGASIDLVDVASGETRRLGAVALPSATDPASWSPDGRWLMTPTQDDTGPALAVFDVARGQRVYWFRGALRRAEVLGWWSG